MPDSSRAGCRDRKSVIDQLRGLLRAPEVVVRTWRAARHSGDNISEAEVREALERLDPLWDELFPGEQTRIVRLLVERVEVHLNRLDVRLRTAGLTQLVGELRGTADHARRAA
jgi:site-specific DNA recombinase